MNLYKLGKFLGYFLMAVIVVLAFFGGWYIINYLIR